MEMRLVILIISFDGWVLFPNERQCRTLYSAELYHEGLGVSM